MLFLGFYIGTFPFQIMPVVLETKTGQTINFLKPHFLPGGGEVEIEMFPHLMIPRIISHDDRYAVSLEIRRLFHEKKEKFDPEMRVNIYSYPNNPYKRTKYHKTHSEQMLFGDNIIIIAVETMGFSDIGNSLCKGSEPWAVHPLDPYREETQKRQIYTYGIYADYYADTPRTFFGPLHLPYFKDESDPRPLTKNNVPVIFNRLTKFLTKKVKVHGLSCIRLQRLVTDEDDIPVLEEQLVENQIAAFQKEYVENPKMRVDNFKDYINYVEQLWLNKKEKWLESLKLKKKND